MQSYFLYNLLLPALKNYNINLKSGEVLQVKWGLMDLHHRFETFTSRSLSGVTVFLFGGHNVQLYDFFIGPVSGGKGSSAKEHRDFAGV